VKGVTKLETNLKITSGEVIVFTDGEHYEFGIAGFAVSLQDFDMGEQAREYVKETGRYDYGEAFSKSQSPSFIPWMVIKQLIMPVEYKDIHLGVYGRFDSDFGVIKPK
jgi:hypothetical protein